MFENIESALQKSKKNDCRHSLLVFRALIILFIFTRSAVKDVALFIKCAKFNSNAQCILPFRH